MVTMTAVSNATEVKPAVVYDAGSKFDKSFNEGVWNGVQRFSEETGIAVMEFVSINITQSEQAMRRMLERGAIILLGVGFAQADAIAKLVADDPDAQFAIIDVDWLDATNLRQYVFKEHESSANLPVAILAV